jgi:hypothetical protein
MLLRFEVEIEAGADYGSKMEFSSSETGIVHAPGTPLEGNQEASFDPVLSRLTVLIALAPSNVVFLML